MKDFKMTIESTLSPVAYTASGSAVVFGMNAMDLAAYIGAAVAIATFIINWYYKAEALKVQKELAHKGIPSDSQE